MNTAARACYTDPRACLAKIARAGRLAARISEALRLLSIAKAPGFRFQLEAADTAIVIPSIEDELRALRRQAEPLAKQVHALRARGFASDEICRALDLLPGEATELVRFCRPPQQGATMRIAKTSPIVGMYHALVAAGLQPTVRLNRRTVGRVREADRFVVWEMVQLRPDFFAAHFNDVDEDPPTFFGPLDSAVVWLRDRCL